MGYALKLNSVDFSAVAVDRVNYIEPVPCTGISLNQSSLSFEKVEDTYQLIATVTPLDTTDAITWASSNQNIATVTDGLVTIHGIGTATITATCGNFSASATINQTTIKAQYPYKTISDRTLSTSTYNDVKILVTQGLSGQSGGGQAYTDTDDLRIKNGELYDIECIRVPYGATSVNVDTTGNKPNYIEVVDTNLITTVQGSDYPQWIKNQSFPFSSGSYAVEFGQAFAFRGATANIEAVNYVYFE